MTISVICAWIAVISLILTASKFVVKKNKKLNRISRKIHIPAGILLIVSGLIHGLLAGNSPNATLAEASIGTELFSLNLGTLCFVLAIALGLSYYFRKQLKRGWIQIHHGLTIIILLVLFLHVAQMGITLPGLFKTGQTHQASVPQTIESTTEKTEDTESSETNTVTAEITDETNESQQEQLDVTFSGATLNDGTYEGSAEGFKSTIQVSVTVENGSVTSVDVISQGETDKFWNQASSLTETIVDEQSLEVDAVSGATYSSKGILCAVYDALEEAVSDGELQITIPEPSGHHGKH